MFVGPNVSFTNDHVPRAKVLTAETIMNPVEGDELPTEETVPFDTTLEKLIPRIGASNGLLSVVDEQGAVIGVLDQHTVLVALGEVT